MVYVGSCSGVYYAFERDTGEVRWSYDTKADGVPATFHTNPVVTERLVVTGTDGGAPGYVYAFDRMTGQVRWKRILPQGQVSADLALAGDSILALGSNGDLVALDAETGEARWVFDAPSDPYRQRGSLAAGATTIYTAGMDEAIYAIRVADGRQLWRRELGSEVTTSILLRGDRLYVGTADGQLLRLDTGSGEVVARIDAGEAPGDTLVPLAAGVCFLRRPPSRKLTAIDAELRQIGWVREPEKGSWSTDRPILWKGLLLAGDNQGNLLALDPEDGSIAWSTALEGQIRGLGHAGDTLFVGTIEGRLYALTPELGGSSEGTAGRVDGSLPGLPASRRR